MKKRSKSRDSDETEDPRLAWKDLWEINLKLRGMAYLIFNQTDDPAPPLDLEEIQQGIGMVLEELAEEVHEIWRTLDEAQAVDAKEDEVKRKPKGKTVKNSPTRTS